MRFVILNVEHGFAAYAVATDASLLLFDCGYSSATRPSEVLYRKGFRTIRRLFISHYDEDHIGDLPQLSQLFHIETLRRNKSLPVAKLREMKSVVTPAMSKVIRMCESYNQPASAQHPGIEVSVYSNRYPEFTDTNNLSLLIFLNVGGTRFVLPGDLEHAGWMALLKNQDVRSELRYAHYFVASHHGRENGYCREVFDYCTPKAVVFSDSAVAHDTQKMASTYGQQATGIQFKGQQRRVLTTRRDGDLTWDL